jgi:hypothetical protein
MDYIKEKHTDLLPLCQGIYQFKDKSYWKMFERESAAMAKINGCQYVDNELPYGRSPKGYPALLTTSYHEEIRGSENTGKSRLIAFYHLCYFYESGKSFSKKSNI